MDTDDQLMVVPRPTSSYVLVGGTITTHRAIGMGQLRTGVEISMTPDETGDLIEELEGLAEAWEQELAQERVRARNITGLTDTYTLEGKATGLNIARTELKALIEEYQYER